MKRLMWWLDRAILRETIVKAVREYAAMRPRNVTLHCAALGDAKAVATYRGDPNVGAGHVEPSENGEGNVSVRTLDSYDIPCTFLKLDVEGCEFFNMIEFQCPIQLMHSIGKVFR